MMSESGDKFGKSSGTPVWLNAQKTSPFQLYQYMIRRPDSEMERLLHFFTFLPVGEIENTLRKHEKRPEARLAQQKMAENVTLLVHGEEGLNLARTSTDIIYNSNVQALSTMDVKNTRLLFQQADFVQKLYQPGISVLGE